LCYSLQFINFFPHFVRGQYWPRTFFSKHLSTN
jgi:hypothetical protein